MLMDDNFSSIAPLKITHKEIYPYVLRCALFSDATKNQSACTKGQVSVGEPQNPASSKATANLLELLVGCLAEELLNSEKSEIISVVCQNLLPSLKCGFTRFSGFLNSIPKEKISYRIGNVETLIMLFSSSIPRTKGLKSKSPDRQSSVQVDESTQMFVEILELILSEKFKSHSACSNMLARLDSYGRSPPNDEVATKENSQAILLYVQQLFGWSDQEYARFVKGYLPVCNIQSHFQDVKKCLVHLELGLQPYFTSQEYLSKDSHLDLKTQERIALSQMVTCMVLEEPGLLTLSLESDKNEPTDYRARNFVFVPKRPRDAYRELVKLITRNELVGQGLHIFSATSRQLLNICAKKWRITGAVRFLAQLEVTAQLYLTSELDFDFLVESMVQAQAYLESYPCQEWAACDRELLLAIFQHLTDKFLGVLLTSIGEPSKMTVSFIIVLHDTLTYFFDSFSFQEAKITRGMYLDLAKTKMEDMLIQAKEGLYNMDGAELLHLQLAAKIITRDIRLLSRMFPRPLLGTIDVPRAATECLLKQFLENSESLLFGRTSLDFPLQDALNFHDAATKLFQFGATHSPDTEIPSALIGWFKVQFSKWLAALDGQALGWVEMAIKYDTFAQVSTHSSSADDLFSSFRSQLDFLQSLTWPNELIEARSMAKVTKVIYESIQLYASRMERLFLPVAHKRSASSLSNWNFFNIKPNTKQEIPKYVAINNLYRLRTMVQELFQTIDCARYSKVLEGKTHQSEAKMFTITVRQAEYLMECENGKDNDAYVVLSTHGRKLLTTTVQWSNAHPQWNESADVTLSYGQDIIIQVFDKDILKDDLCGEGFLHLSPKDNWGDEDADLWVELAPQGRILLSISSEEEADDPLYYVRRSLYLLGRTENELIRQLSSKFLNHINDHLSRTALLSRFPSRDHGSLRSIIGRKVEAEISFSDTDCDDALAPLVELLDSHLHSPYSNLYSACGHKLILSLWRECLNSVLAEMVPPFSENRKVPKPLLNSELEFFIRAIELLKFFFHGGDDGDGLPLDALETSDYFLLKDIYNVYFSGTEDLIEEYMILYKKFVNGPLKVQSPEQIKSNILLRLIRMRNERVGLNFVNIQLEIKSKMIEWSVEKAPPIKASYQCVS